MGGTIAVTIREPNGKEHRMNRWTNPTPFFINNVGLINKDQKHIDTYMEQWQNMRADWLKHKEQFQALVKEIGREEAFRKYKFDNHMTPCYAPYTTLAPKGYGLLVVDMVNNLILHAQEYSSYGTIYTFSLKRDLELRHGVKQLYEASAIKGIIGFCQSQSDIPDGATIGSRNKNWISFVLPLDRLGIKSYEDLEEACYHNNNGCNKYSFETDFQLQLDLSPFSIEEFEQTKEGYKKFYDRIKSLNFELSHKEEEQWKEYCDE